MDWQEKFFLVAILVLFVAIDAAQANTMELKYKWHVVTVMGRSQCQGKRLQIWFGNYAIGFDGTPDLSGCYAQISSSTGSGCVVSAGPAQSLRLVFRMFDMGMYVVDSLLTQPAQPMSFCPKSSNPVPAPVTLVNPLPKPVTPASPPPFRLPPNALIAATATTALVASNAANALLGSYSMPTSWTLPEHKCYWRAVNPNTKVAVIFGPVVARRYGTDLTLWQGLQGRGDPYRTLLREGITAFLNSYNSLQFPYNSIAVVQHLNWALMGSNRNVLLKGLRFIRANSGYGKVPCKFTACK
ncbi:hypothetical protein C1H46_030351 [Malus baccata]|uniref:Uncharacterized protein n=1 Tax=Malus baccata TaxID=106549 RepID=A0A540LCS5_MALBA|nr:hypothetical protein C1H46_030351 [Malus baccata]